MLRKVVTAAVVLVFGVGVVMAAEISGVITKVDGDKVTFHETKKGEKGDAKTLPADGAKVLKGQKDKETKKFVGEPLEGGLKNAMFAKIGDKGVPATIVTDADNKKITEIRVKAAKKK